MTKIDFKQEAIAPGSKDFQKDGVTITTFESGGAQVNPDGIDPTKGFIAAYRTECALPLSNPVTLSLLVMQAVEVTAYGTMGTTGPYDVLFKDEVQTLAFTNVRRLVIKAKQQDLIEAYIDSLEWTPVPKKKDGGTNKEKK